MYKLYESYNTSCARKLPKTLLSFNLRNTTWCTDYFFILVLYTCQTFCLTEQFLPQWSNCPNTIHQKLICQLWCSYHRNRYSFLKCFFKQFDCFGRYGCKLTIKSWPSFQQCKLNCIKFVSLLFYSWLFYKNNWIHILLDNCFECTWLPIWE